MNRRNFLGQAVLGSVAVAGGLAYRSSAPAAIITPNADADSPLLQRAKAAMDQHRQALSHTDRIGIADYGRHSAKPRFHIIDLANGTSRSFLVTHGKGSDPRHTGWLKAFSNVPGSEASSGGSYMTSQIYTGKHGRSQRLKGLDPSNDMAEARAIVIHGAWYAEPDIVGKMGKLGRSQGCFAFAKADLPIILEQLGEGRLLFAGKS